MHPTLSRWRSGVRCIQFYNSRILTWHLIVVSEQLVRLQLAQEVEEGEQDYVADLEESQADDHPSVVILNGLRLEDDQCVIPTSISKYSHIDRCRLGADLQRISRLWDCIQHPSRLLRWSNVQITYAVASRIGLNFKSSACLKRASLDNEMQRLSPMALHPTNLRISHSTFLRPTSLRFLFSSQTSGNTSFGSEKDEHMTHFMKCASTFAFAPTFSSERTNIRGESATTPAPIPQSINVKLR